MADLTPVTREEQFLDKIAEALETGGGGLICHTTHINLIK